MLTPEEANILEPKERAAMLADLCKRFYGKRYTDTLIAAEFGIHHKTPANWRKKPESIPNAVLFTLSAWTTRKETLAADLRNRLADAAEAFATSAELFAAVSRDLR